MSRALVLNATFEPLSVVSERRAVVLVLDRKADVVHDTGAVGGTGVPRALVLNATYEPLCIVTTRRALLLVLDEKAELLHDTGHAFHSERAAFPEPSVVRLTYFVRVPYVARVALNRRAVFARDGH